jgi:hypothetical protein
MSIAVETAMRFLTDALGAYASGIQDNFARPVPTMITAARHSYPWPLHLGNTLWSIVAYRQVRDALPPSKRPGTMTAIAVAFCMYAMAGSLAVAFLLGIPPGALQSDVIIPTYVLCWFAVQYSPGDLVFRLLSRPGVLFLLGTLSELDGYTTSLNYMEEAYHVSSGGLVHPLLCALSVVMAGCSSRHFAALGFSEGIARYDDAFRTDYVFLSLIFSLYYYGALLPCAGEPACAARTGLFEALPLLAISRSCALEGLGALAPQPLEPPSVVEKAKAD